MTEVGERVKIIAVLARHRAVWAMLIVPASMFAGGVAATASGSPHWSITATPSPTGALTAELRAVSCTSAAVCMGVGSYQTGSTGKTMVQRWNGTTWKHISSPNPSGATGSYFFGVSCSSTTSCAAVGWYATAGHPVRALAQRWNGTAWSTVSAANPTGSTGAILRAVSCTAVSACIAVGDYRTASDVRRTLIERWNGTTWKILASPNPTGAIASLLTGVSCISTAACMADGSADYASAPTKTLVERWNGTTWKITASPNPSGANDSRLYGMSCTSATACTAVGDYVHNYSFGPIDRTLVERWSGTAWKITASANPTGTTEAALFSVRCTGSAACTAVGTYVATSPTSRPLAERWNGTAWSISPTPQPTGSMGTDLFGVSCSATSACMAVGDYVYDPAQDTRMLAERYGV